MSASLYRATVVNPLRSCDGDHMTIAVRRRSGELVLLVAAFFNFFNFSLEPTVFLAKTLANCDVIMQMCHYFYCFRITEGMC